MRHLAVSLLLLAGLTAGGCSFLRFLNPVYNGVELNQTIAFEQDGVALEVRSLYFRRTSGDSLGDPFVAYNVENRTGSPVALRPAGTRVVVGPDTLAPISGRFDPRTVGPGETAEVSLSFRYAVGVNDLRSRPVTLLVGGIEAGGAAVRFPSVDYVLAEGEFLGGRVRPSAPAVE